MLRTAIAATALVALTSLASAEVIANPVGCPRTRFCGCAVWLKLTGKVVTRGGPAQARWYRRFPRAAPGPGMVVVYGNHHVALILHVDGNGNAALYDPNSGGHKTRIHTRSIRGAVVVNPHGAKASL